MWYILANLFASTNKQGFTQMMCLCPSKMLVLQQLIPCSASSGVIARRMGICTRGCPFLMCVAAMRPRPWPGMCCNTTYITTNKHCLHIIKPRVEDLSRHLLVCGAMMLHELSDMTHTTAAPLCQLGLMHAHKHSMHSAANSMLVQVLCVMQANLLSW